ncbi:chaperone protein dnaJ 20, chloroplastic-like [Prosopis cineraria]|uniref:chaperone protein dnaJ 20, chloroplastic-like n=1 Tax=Prosopis cineraria TaxID=364024 RepID=UPI00240F7206|nr:chaperone protein dnaJ 20, chloroplastic-like [Prosopis cineraria]
MLYSGLSTLSGSDSRFFNLPTPLISTTKSFKSSSVRLPASSRSVSLKVRSLSVAEPSGFSFYELLGISESGSLPDIKQAYKQLARKYHPDVSPPDRVDEYTKMFIKLHEAYETLSDPTKRAMYDRGMDRGLAYATYGIYFDEERIQRNKEWRERWEAQLSKLKNRTTNKYGDRSHSWASRIRRENKESLN